MNYIQSPLNYTGGKYKLLPQNLDYHYVNCNYQGKNTDKPTIEVLITNY